MARIDSAYNYFMSTYGDSIGSRYESHKKSELRDTYNKIVKANKDSPLYKIKDTEDMGQFAIDIKEHANSMSISVSNLTSNGEDIESILSKRIASSSDPNTIEAAYVGDEETGSTEEFTIEVDSLAKPQINTGNFLAPQDMNFKPGQYTFDLDIKNHSYEFQFNVNPGEDNLAIQNKIVRLINTSDVGLNAQLITNRIASNAIQVSSKATGIGEDETRLFNISSTISRDELDILGISRVTQEPSNSDFKLNGTEHQSLSNVFTVNKAYELYLKAPTKGEVTIGLKNDTEALTDGVNQMLDSYNGMIDVGLRYTGAHQNRTLFNEISSIARGMTESLAFVGITADENGHLSLDSERLADVINSDDKASAFSTLNELKSAVRSAASKASINPMAYVDKAVVEYKNPGKTLTAPYATSQYSGMMVNYGL